MMESSKPLEVGRIAQEYQKVSYVNVILTIPVSEP